MYPLQQNLRNSCNQIRFLYYASSSPCIIAYSPDIHQQPMQKNILFSLFAILASVFVIAFGMTTYRYYQAIHSDDPISPYLLVEK